VTTRSEVSRRRSGESDNIQVLTSFVGHYSFFGSRGVSLRSGGVWLGKGGVPLEGS
jgi:hypothetical protein